MFGGQGGREVSFSSNRIMGALRSPQVRKKLKPPLPTKISKKNYFESKYFFILLQGSPRQSDDDSDEEEEDARGNGSPQKTPESNGARAKVNT